MSSKHILSNNKTNSNILNLKSNTIPPFNSNMSFKKDQNNINNNLEISKIVSLNKLNTTTHSTSLCNSTVKTKTTLASKQINIPNLTSLILTPTKVSISNFSSVSSQSPIIHYVVRISQQINKSEAIDDTKDVLSNNKRKFENWFGGKYYNYRSNNDNLLSLPCPADNWKCGMFSHVFDNNDVNIKNVLLKKTLKGTL